MELSELKSTAPIGERLSYVDSLLELMSGQDDRVVRALTGGLAMWIGAVDETLEAANPLLGAARYRTRRAQESGGQTIIGLRLARNEIAHGTALVTASGARFPLRFPVNFGLSFIAADELADHYRARREKELREHDLRLYREHVAQRGPGSVMRAARDWLRSVTSGE
ncbi:hypothetical protein [Leucobacter sp. GX24907]